MFTRISLHISGYRGQPVPNTFLRQAEETRHLALLFPGYGYNADLPLLYYPGLLLTTRGADLLRVEYAYNRLPEFPSLSEAERDHWLATDVRAAWETAAAQRPYERFTLLGKSIGTLAMGHLLETVERLRQADCLWLTPLLRIARLRNQIKMGKGRALFAIGTADSHYLPALLDEVAAATRGQSVIIEGGDHSLEIAGDVIGSLRALQQLMEALDTLL